MTNILTYPGAVSKGQRLLDLMLQDSCTLQTPFLHTSDLSKWGWGRVEFPYEQAGTGEQKKLIEECNHGGNPDHLKATLGISDLHDETVIVDSIEYRATMGMFYSVPNPKVGILIAFYTNTPNAIATGNGVDLVRYPPLALCHWSDVAFLQWASLSVEGVIPDLKFVARVSISNEHTIAVLQTVLSKLRKEQRAPENRLPTWPGINFPMETEEAKALLGTPNGAGIAWLLAQHKKELGHKTVETVRLWYSKYVGTPNLLFHLKNVEAPGLTDGPTKAASPFALTS